MEEYRGGRYNPFPRRVGADPNDYSQDPTNKNKKKKNKQSRPPKQNVPAFYHGMPHDYYVPRQVEPHVIPQDIVIMSPGGGSSNQWYHQQPLDKGRKNKNKDKAKNAPPNQGFFGSHQPVNGNHFNVFYDNAPRGDQDPRIYGVGGMEPPSRPKKGLPRTYFFEEPPGNPTYATTITRSIPDGPETSEEIPGLIMYRGQGNDYHPRPSKPDQPADPEAVLKDFDAQLAEFDTDNNEHMRATQTGTRPKDDLPADITRIHGPPRARPVYTIPKPPQVGQQGASTSVDSVVNHARPTKPVSTHDQEKSYDFQGDEEINPAMSGFDALQVNDPEATTEPAIQTDPKNVATAIGGLPEQQEVYKKHRESDPPVAMELELQDSSSYREADAKTVTYNSATPENRPLDAELVSKIPEVPAGEPAKIEEQPKSAYAPVAEVENGNSSAEKDPPTVNAMDAELVSKIPDAEISSPEGEEIPEPRKHGSNDAKQEGDQTKTAKSEDAYDKYCKNNEHCHIVPEEATLYHPGEKNAAPANPTIAQDSDTKTPPQMKFPSAPVPENHGCSVDGLSPGNNPVLNSRLNPANAGINTNTNPNNIRQSFVNGGQQFSIGMDNSEVTIDPVTGKPSNWQRLN